MAKQLILGAALAIAVCGMAAADPADGVWKTAEGEEGGYLHVSIAPCGSAICGIIDTAFDAEGNESLEYEHLGKKIIWNMIPNGDGSYSDGKVWAPDTDKTYKSKMSLSGNTLVVKGCVAGGLICRGQNWTRFR